MKKVKYILLLFLFSFSMLVSAQEIPNPSFENWTGGQPDGWWIVNSQLYTNVIQSSTAHTGNSSLRVEIIEFHVPPAPPIPTAGMVWWGNSSGGFTIPITQNYTVLKGFYQYYPVQSGMQTGPSILITLINSQTGAVAQGEVDLISETIDSWQSFSVGIEYDDPIGIAELAQIIITYSGLDPNFQLVPGTYFLMDDLSFEGSTGVTKEDDNLLSEFSLEQNYPNPFNPTTNIKFSIPEESFVNLKVYDAKGAEVATLVNQELSAGNYNADWDASGITSGVYVYVLKTKDFIQSRKMILMK